MCKKTKLDRLQQMYKIREALLRRQPTSWKVAEAFVCKDEDIKEYSAIIESAYSRVGEMVYNHRLRMEEKADKHLRLSEMQVVLAKHNERIQKEFKEYWQEGVFAECQPHLWMSRTLLCKFFKDHGYSAREIERFLTEGMDSYTIGRDSHNPCSTFSGVHNFAPVTEYHAETWYVCVQKGLMTRGERYAHDHPLEYAEWKEGQKKALSKSNALYEAFCDIPQEYTEEEGLFEDSDYFDWWKRSTTYRKEFNNTVYLLTHEEGKKYWDQMREEEAWPGESPYYDYYTLEIINAHGSVLNTPWD